jgi:hypothetical protein
MKCAKCGKPVTEAAGYVAHGAERTCWPCAHPSPAEPVSIPGTGLCFAITDPKLGTPEVRAWLAECAARIAAEMPKRLSGPCGACFGLGWQNDGKPVPCAACGANP